jgi:hypothetical protein
VNIFFHLNSLPSSILLIFRKFSTSFIKGSHGDSAVGFQPIAASENLLIHGVEEIPIVLGGLHLLQ